MACISKTLRGSQWLRATPLRSPQAWITTRMNSSYAALESEMRQRKIQPIFDDLSPQSSYRLDITLADHLPNSSPPSLLPSASQSTPLPIPHHLVYFEPTKRGSVMLADGTNPDQSPGDPFVRRMWAGGRVNYNNANPLVLDSSRGVCAEFIRSVTAKGKPGDEKLFVAIERRLAKASPDEVARLADATAHEQAREDLEHRVRQRLWRDEETDFGPCSIVETRNIVFMHARTPEQAKQAAAAAGSKILKPQHKPDWTHTVNPDAKLLFRFSALTFNAHSIHLDPQYSREVEGHRNLLFHGPLSYTFMMTLMQQQLGMRGNDVVKRVEYKNLAPLYSGEPVTFCGTQTDEGKWEVWTETPEGGIAVKGTVWTEPGTIDKSNLGK